MRGHPEYQIVPLDREAIESTQIYDAIVELWRTTEGTGLSESDSRKHLLLYVDRNPGTSFMAKAGGRIAGAVLGGHDGRRGVLYHLAVHPAFRRKGIGRCLVEMSLNAIQAAGIRKCHIFIYRNNSDGLTFWQGAGWEERFDVGILSNEMDRP